MDKRDKLYETVNKPGQKKEATFSRYYDPDHPRHLRYHARFPMMIENILGPKLLDFGCGTGLLCHLLLKERDDIEEIHAVDLQEAILEEARENVKSDKVTFHNGFVEELKFEDEYFNTVVLGETLEHVYSVDKTLAESYRVLKPGGRVIITCPYKGKISKLHVRSISKSFMKEKVSKYFKITKLEVVNYPGQGPKGVFCIGVKNA